MLRETGLDPSAVHVALVELERAGIVTAGSIASGRADILTPAVLDLMGIEALALPWHVLPDVDPPGGGIVARTDRAADDIADVEWYRTEAAA